MRGIGCHGIAKSLRKPLGELGRHLVVFSRDMRANVADDLFGLTPGNRRKLLERLGRDALHGAAPPRVYDRKRAWCDQDHRYAIRKAQQHGHIVCRAHHCVDSPSRSRLRRAYGGVGGVVYHEHLLAMHLARIDQSFAQVCDAHCLEHAPPIRRNSCPVITAVVPHIERGIRWKRLASRALGKCERDPARATSVA